MSDPDRLWVANLHAAPAAWEVATLVPHSWTDGVLAFAGRRYDILSRERAAAGLADPSLPAHLQAPLQLAAALGPSFTDTPRFPTGLVAVLDRAARMAASTARFHRGDDGVVLWRPLPDNAWAAPPPRDEWGDVAPDWTWSPDEM